MPLCTVGFMYGMHAQKKARRKKIVTELKWAREKRFWTSAENGNCRELINCLQICISLDSKVIGITSMSLWHETLCKSYSLRTNCNYNMNSIKTIQETTHFVNLEIRMILFGLNALPPIESMYFQKDVINWNQYESKRSVLLTNLYFVALKHNFEIVAHIQCARVRKDGRVRQEKTTMKFNKRKFRFMCWLPLWWTRWAQT